jgi:peptidoglycan/LPS O-acetylase OafA/YrhL
MAAVLVAAAVVTCYPMLVWWFGPLPGATVIDRYAIAPLHLNPNLNLLGTALFVVAGGVVVAGVAYRRALPRPWLVVAVQVTACWVVVSAAAGGVLGLAAGTAAAMAPAFVLGQVVWLGHARRVPPWAAAGLGLAAWTVFCWGQRLGYDLGQDHNPLTLATAGSLVAVALLAGSRGTARPPPNGEPASSTNRFVFIDIIRSVAAPLVVYSHVITLWLEPNGMGGTAAVQVIDAVIRQPLELQQHFGHLAVVLFFLVSGFIVTHVGVKEAHREFGVKRVLRIYPLLAVAVLVSAVVGVLGSQVLDTGQRYELTPASMLTNMLLLNYLMVPQVVLVGVAWTLVVEVIFYTTILVLLALLRRRTWLAIAVELELVFIVVLLARSFGASFFLFAVSVSFLPVLLVGQTIWAVWSGRIPLWAGLIFGVVASAIYIWAANLSMGRIDDAYCSTFAFATLLFLVGLLAEPRLRRNRIVSYFADRSYSIYLLHGVLAFPVMLALYPVLPLPVCLLAGLGATLAAVEITYRFVEVTGQRLARRLTRRYRPLRAHGPVVWQGGARRATRAHHAGPARQVPVGRTR